jgi:hypothetical protein
MPSGTVTGAISSRWMRNGSVVPQTHPLDLISIPMSAPAALGEPRRQI